MPHYCERIILVEDAAVASEFHEIVRNETRGRTIPAHLRIHESGFKFEQNLS
jgi:predicted solute-binding protein